LELNCCVFVFWRSRYLATSLHATVLIRIRCSCWRILHFLSVIEELLRNVSCIKVNRFICMYNLSLILQERGTTLHSIDTRNFLMFYSKKEYHMAKRWGLKLIANPIFP
jgi:hypothetical protein